MCKNASMFGVCKLVLRDSASLVFNTFTTFLLLETTMHVLSTAAIVSARILSCTVVCLSRPRSTKISFA